MIYGYSAAQTSCIIVTSDTFIFSRGISYKINILLSKDMHLLISKVLLQSKVNGIVGNFLFVDIIHTLTAIGMSVDRLTTIENTWPNSP